MKIWKKIRKRKLPWIGALMGGVWSVAAGLWHKQQYFPYSPEQYIPEIHVVQRGLGVFVNRYILRFPETLMHAIVPESVMQSIIHMGLTLGGNAGATAIALVAIFAFGVGLGWLTGVLIEKVKGR